MFHFRTRSLARAFAVVCTALSSMSCSNDPKTSPGTDKSNPPTIVSVAADKVGHAVEYKIALIHASTDDVFRINLLKNGKSVQEISAPATSPGGIKEYGNDTIIPRDSVLLTFVDNLGAQPESIAVSVRRTGANSFVSAIGRTVAPAPQKAATVPAPAPAIIDFCTAKSTTEATKWTFEVVLTNTQAGDTFEVTLSDFTTGAIQATFKNAELTQGNVGDCAGKVPPGITAAVIKGTSALKPGTYKLDVTVIRGDTSIPAVGLTTLFSPLAATATNPNAT